jgi:hypothetical protein
MGDLFFHPLTVTQLSWRIRSASTIKSIAVIFPMAKARALPPREQGVSTVIVCRQRAGVPAPP